MMILIGCASHWVESSKEKDNLVIVLWWGIRNNLTLIMNMLTDQSIHECVHHFYPNFLDKGLGKTFCCLDRLALPIMHFAYFLQYSCC